MGAVLKQDTFVWVVCAVEEQPTPVTKAEKAVNDVIDVLNARSVGDVDRGRLRGALDKADAPLGGREGMDQGLGRAIGRTARHPFAFGW